MQSLALSYKKISWGTWPSFPSFIYFVVVVVVGWFFKKLFYFLIFFKHKVNILSNDIYVFFFNILVEW